jgi:hypothetical protein
VIRAERAKCTTLGALPVVKIGLGGRNHDQKCARYLATERW